MLGATAPIWIGTIARQADLCLRQDDVFASNAADLGNTAEQHRRFHLAGEMRVHALHARSASDGQAPKDRTPDRYGRRTECKRLEDIDAAPDTAVQNDRGTTLAGINRCSQHRNGGRNAVDLTAAMVRDPDAGRAGGERLTDVLDVQQAFDNDGKTRGFAQKPDVAVA